MQRQIILASTSPRRRELFKLLNVKFKAVDSGYEEIMDQSMRHDDMVRFLALGKAHSAAKKYPKAVIISADTVVSFKGKAIGKPRSNPEAQKMLKSFSGKAQDVVTGTVVLDAVSKRVVTNVTKIKVHFKKISAKEINDYIKTGEPFDKAGGYAPNGGGMNLIKKIEGEFTSCLGLPLGVIVSAFEKLNIKI
jgi:septum formation protein